MNFLNKTTLCLTAALGLSATPLTKQDKDILKQLNLNDIEAITYDSFDDLISEAQKRGTRFALAVVKDIGNNHIFFYNLSSLLSSIEASKAFKNPMTGSNIESIRIYLWPKHPHIFGEGHQFFEEFVGELREMPQEGFYQYMKRKEIDTERFTGPFKNYSPTNLPQDPDELRRLAYEYYPVDQQTLLAAKYRLSISLYNDAIRLSSNNFTEVKNLLQTITQSPMTPPKMWDTSAFFLINILKKLPYEELKKEQNNMLSLLKRLVRPDSTLDDNAKLDSARFTYLVTLTDAKKTVTEIKELALSILNNPETSFTYHQRVIEFIGNMYNTFKSRIDRNTYTDDAKRIYAQEFIAAFPNGQIL